MPLRPRFILLLACALPALWPLSGAATDSAVLAVGAGVQRMPAWPGAKNDREDPVPYIDVELPGVGSFSTLDGLELEFLHGPALRGGLYGVPPALDWLDGNGNLPVGVDFRSVYATVLEHWWGIDSRPVLGQRFPLLPVLRA